MAFDQVKMIAKLQKAQKELKKEIVEVEDPKEAGTEIVEEVVEVDENGKVIHEEKI